MTFDSQASDSQASDSQTANPQASVSGAVDRPDASPSAEPPPSYIKLAMRNMVRKGGKSLYHFTLTAAALLAIAVGLSYLTR